MAQPPHKKQKSSMCFQNLTFCMTGAMSMGTRKHVSCVIQAHGGSVANTVTGTVTHLVASDAEFLGETNKVVTAKAKGTTIVSEGFLEACLETGKKVDETPYILSKGSDGGTSLSKKKKNQVKVKKIDAEGNVEEGASSNEEELTSNKKLKYVVKGRSAVDPLCRHMVDDYHVLEEGDVIYSVMLNMADIAYGTKGSNKFYVLQLLEHDKKPEYHVYTRWGRGKSVAWRARVGQRRSTQYKSKADAKDAFNKKFKEKSGNNFEDRDTFDKQRPGKYNVVEIDYGDDIEEEDTKSSKAKHKEGTAEHKKGAAKHKEGATKHKGEMDKHKKRTAKHKEETGEPVWSSDSASESEPEPEPEPELKHKKIHSSSNGQNTKYYNASNKQGKFHDESDDGSETEKEDEDILGVTKYFPKAANSTVKYGKKVSVQLDSGKQIVQPQSTLHPKVQEFIKLISDKKMMKRELMKMDVDLKKMPLGKLNKKQIKKGYEVLKDIHETLKSGGNQSELIQLSNAFYTLIPHDIGFQKLPVIDKALLKQKLSLLETLADIEIATSLLEGQDGDDDPTAACYKSLKAQIAPLDPSDEMYSILVQYVNNTHGPTHDEYGLEVLDIFSVERENEAVRFEKHNNLERHLLWHGSRLSNFMGIISQGLRIAPPEAPVTGYMFGKGVYFADIATKSANYCHPSPTNNVGCLILSEVALGESYSMYKAQYFEKPPQGFHSIKGVGKWIPNPKDAFVLDDGMVIPAGKPVDNPDILNKTTTLNYNEFIVYDVSQVKVRYLLKVQFNYKSSATKMTTLPVSKKGVWQFKSGTGWKNYDDAVNKMIQKNKIAGNNVFSITINGTKYTVDLDDNVQYPNNDSTKTRQIRYYL